MIYSEDKIELTFFEQSILDCIEIYCAEYLRQYTYGLRPDFTKNLITELGRLMHENGLWYNPNATEGEWLYDFIGYDLDKDGNLISLKLCLESELSNRTKAGLRYDFQKLLICKAETKVMLAAVKKTEAPIINSYFQDFERWVNRYNCVDKSERFLVLLWDDWTTGKLHPAIITPG